MSQNSGMPGFGVFVLSRLWPFVSIGLGSGFGIPHNHFRFSFSFWFRSLSLCTVLVVLTEHRPWSESCMDHALHAQFHFHISHSNSCKLGGTLLRVLLMFLAVAITLTGHTEVAYCGRKYLKGSLYAQATFSFPAQSKHLAFNDKPLKCVLCSSVLCQP